MKPVELHGSFRPRGIEYKIHFRSGARIVRTLKENEHHLECIISAPICFCYGVDSKKPTEK
jgi:hypothetical protein